MAAHDIAPAAILTELQKILADPAFECSERNKKFLRYIVEETLAGRAGRLKGYTIAIAVFERDASFDAQSDPLVRIEAGRLRRRLERYYLTAGRNDPIRITIPKGAYVPVFAARTAETDEPPAPVNARAGGRRFLFRQTSLPLVAALLAAIVIGLLPWLRTADVADTANFNDDITLGPALLVTGFRNISGDASQDGFAAGLTEEIKTALVRFKAMRIYGAAAASNLEVDYVLSGTVRGDNNHYRISAHVSDFRSGKQLWSERYERDIEGHSIIAAQGEIAHRVAEAVGFPYNALFVEEAKRVSALKSKTHEAYQCLLRMHDYWVDVTPELHRELRVCHEKIIAANPDHVGALVNLAWIHLNAYRFGLEGERSMEGLLVSAFDFARRAIYLDPKHARARYALAVLHWFQRDMPAFHQEAAYAHQLNPADVFIAAEYGLRLGMLRQWDRALPLLLQAGRQNPSRPSFYRFALSLHALDLGDFAQAQREAEAIDVEIGVKYLLLASLHGHLERTKRAEAAFENARALDPAATEDVKANLARRNLDPVLIEKVVQGLAKAGLHAMQE